MVSGSPSRTSLADDEVAIAKNRPSPLPLTSKPGLPRRQSAFAQPRPDGTPRTPHRVRFEVQDASPDGPAVNGQLGRKWVDEEDTYGGDGTYDMNGHSAGQRLPLLTGLEAPSISLASEGDEFNVEDHLESAKPRSGMRAAFMNMANSIMYDQCPLHRTMKALTHRRGAGIIGMGHAFKQAGLFTGIFLLIALTVLVDWTIRLIVINSKLSGANSFQTTMEHCFGTVGLIAISIAQWALCVGTREERSYSTLTAIQCIWRDDSVLHHCRRHDTSRYGLFIPSAS